MVLVADVGNSHTVLGLFEGASLVDRWRITTGGRTGDELGLLLTQLLAARAEGVEALVACTVVPSAVRPLREAAERYLRAPLRLLESTADLEIGRAHV